MSLFDYIKCEYLLPDLPQIVIDNWKGADQIAFQTKDTPNQCMCPYKIDADGQLWRQDRTTQWVEPKDPNSESIFDRLGHSETLSTWWEKEQFTGDISFYDSYHHAEYPTYEPLGSDKWKRFADGWIEYAAVFLRGQLVGDIAVTLNESPKKLTDEEFEQQLKEYEEARKGWDDRAKKNRKEHPTSEQKLIDDIYNYVSAFASSVQGGKNYLVEEIMGKIDCYRETHDKYYEKLN